MFTVAVQRLKWMIIVFFAVFPTLNVITADILVLSLLGYRVKRSMLLGSSLPVPRTFGAQFVFHFYFCQSLPMLQLGLFATADLLVYICGKVRNLALHMQLMLAVRKPKFTQF